MLRPVTPQERSRGGPLRLVRSITHKYIYLPRLLVFVSGGGVLREGVTLGVLNLELLEQDLLLAFAEGRFVEAKGHEYHFNGGGCLPGC